MIGLLHDPSDLLALNMIEDGMHVATLVYIFGQSEPVSL